jgi:hypothetical protein
VDVEDSDAVARAILGMSSREAGSEGRFQCRTVTQLRGQSSECPAERRAVKDASGVC